MSLKVIQLTGQCNEPDDPTLPFKLEAIFRPPEFMQVAFVMLHGGHEKLVVRASTHEELTEFMTQQHLKAHPRLSRWALTGPDGVVSTGP